MDMILTPEEARVLGCMMEKEKTTPEYYPLTVKALLNACNQKSNRHPLMALSEDEVVQAIDSLRDKQLAAHRRTAGSRGLKFGHRLAEQFRFEPPDLAVMAVLLLRGPQTVGELHTRTNRVHHFESLEAIRTTLHDLAEWGEGPFVTELPRQPGQKETRFAQLLCAEPDRQTMPVASAPAPEVAPRTPPPPSPDRVAELEEKLDALTREVDDLRTMLTQFKEQFE